MNKLIIYFKTLVILTILITLSCKKDESQQEVSVPETEISGAIQDTTAEESPVQELTPGLKELEMQKANLEKQIEAMMAELEEKELALLEKQKSLENKEAELDSLQAILVANQARFGQLQRLSWTVFGIGIIALAAGIVLFVRRNKSQSESATSKKTASNKPKTKSVENQSKETIAAQSKPEAKGKNLDSQKKSATEKR